MGQNFEMFFRVRTVTKSNHAQYALAGGEMLPNGRSLFRRLLLRFTHFFGVALKRGDLEGAVSTCWSVAADLHEIRQRGETPASHTMRLLAAGGC